MARTLHRRHLPMGASHSTASGWSDCEGSGLHERPLRPGDRIDGKYLVRRVLGAGGWAVVYEAEHVVMKHGVAIKVLRPDDANRSLARQRFEREARLSATIRHPNVLEAYDVGHLPDGSPYLVMELLRGEDLDSRLASGPLHVAEVLDVGIQLLEALAGLAAHGVLHRDVKPHNLFLHEDEDGHVVLKLLDFGIARQDPHWAAPASKLTTQGELLGTPHYMSPEQLRGEPLDARSDLYAAAVVLYELLTARTPFDEPAQSALLASILRDPVPDIHRFRPDCPEELAHIILRGLSRDREARWRHAMEMREALCAVREALALPAGADAWSPAARMVRNLPPPRLSPRERPSRAATRSVTPPPRANDTPVRLRRRVLALGACLFVAMLLPVAGGLATEAVDRPRSRVAPKRAAMADKTPPPAPTPAPVTRAETTPPRERAAPAPEAKTLTSTRPVAQPAPPDAGELRSRALAAYVRGRLPRARALYQRAVRSAPRDAESWRGLGIVSMAMGRRSEARDALRRYLQLAPRASDAAEIRARLRTL